MSKLPPSPTLRPALTLYAVSRLLIKQNSVRPFPGSLKQKWYEHSHHNSNPAQGEGVGAFFISKN
jgi:hypothetical protein